MARNNDGEFELILGNRQLLSVFFIIVILLGVFFTMGYIVGRNSAPVVAEVQRKATRTAGEDSTAAASNASPASPRQIPAASPTGAAEPKPGRPEPASDKPALPEPESVKTAPARNRSGSAAGDQPVAGQSYLQLAATSKREADVLVDVLRQKGFKAINAEIAEKPGTWRVLVGPVPEGGSNALRSDLQKSGFPGNAAIPRTF